MAATQKAKGHVSGGYTGEFDPDRLYAVDKLAVIFDVSPRWITEHLIRTGKLTFVQLGSDQRLVYGQDFLNWAIRNRQRWGEDGPGDGENP